MRHHEAPARWQVYGGLSDHTHVHVAVSREGRLKVLRVRVETLVSLLVAPTRRSVVSLNGTLALASKV